MPEKIAAAVAFMREHVHDAMADQIFQNVERRV